MRIGAVRRFMKQTIQVLERVDIPDPMGDDEPTWEPAGASRRGSIQPASSRRIEDAARRGSAVTHTAYFLGPAEIETRHRLASGGRIYSVVGPSRDVAGQGGLTELDLEEVRE